MNYFLPAAIIAGLATAGRCAGGEDSTETETKFHIDGRVKVNVAGEKVDEDWTQQIRIVVDDGQHIGIPK